ncbi:hypothetical protein D3C75_672790 [compost metagenome]
MRLQNASAEARVKRAEFRVAPQVTDRRRTYQSEIAPVDFHFSTAAAQVKQRHIIGAVSVVGIPDLLLRPGRYRMRGASRLINGNDFVVGKQLQPVIVQPCQVVTHIQLGCRNRPKGHCGLPLVFGQTVHGTVADIQRIEVVPAAGTGVSPPQCGIGE